jgi:hypothetical protein
MHETWVTRFPDPGPAPAAPEGPEPKAHFSWDAWRLWTAIWTVHRNWVRAHRRHIVAKALDDLAVHGEHAEDRGSANASHRIAMVLGEDYLDPIGKP